MLVRVVVTPVCLTSLQDVWGIGKAQPLVWPRGCFWKVAHEDPDLINGSISRWQTHADNNTSVGNSWGLPGEASVP